MRLRMPIAQRNRPDTPAPMIPTQMAQVGQPVLDGGRGKDDSSATATTIVE